MKTSDTWFRIRFALSLWMIFHLSSHAQTSSRISSSFLARGEQALLEVVVVGAKNTGVPEIPNVRDIAIQFSGRGPRANILPGRILESAYGYIISGYEVGKFVIPPITVVVDGLKTQTEPLEFEIFDPDDLKWSEIQMGERTIRYASSFHIMNSRPFENETTPTEIKVFIPEEILVEDWGIPDFERDGLAVWRFQPSPMRSRINLLGRRYVSVAYPSTITPTRVGGIGIGPAKIRLTTQEQVLDPFPRIINSEIYLQVPKLELESIPLPPGAPEGFENAVGNFRISSSTSVTAVQEGDPISVDLIVNGSGNLDTMRPPSLENPSGWKIYGTTTEQRNDERRQLSGSVISRQSIRPLEMKSEIPPYRLVYFDPRDESYKTVTTEPIALQMTPNVTGESPVPSLAVPFERMTDILATIRPSQLTTSSVTSFPTWLGHAVGGLIALTLLVKAIWMRLAPRLKPDPRRAAWTRELSEIEKSRNFDATEFLKAAGSFIERWQGGNPPPEIQAILTERDAVCFRAEKPTTVLDSRRRGEILRLLYKAAVGCFLITTLGLSIPARAADVASAAQEAYDAAKYEDAVKLWFSSGSYHQLSADTLYNIGNAAYRSGFPGLAALYYRRALVRDSSHQEARQNLRFIERKYGAIVVQRPDYQYALAKIPLRSWQATLWTGVWLSGLALLVFPATRRGAKLRVFAFGALVLGPLFMSIGILGWRHFPDDAEFAPLAKQAVIIAEKVTLHTDAARTAPEVIDAPPGSLCEIITESGRWAYVAFATKTRGWVPLESIEKIIPEKPPESPKFRKPKADGKTA